MADERFLNRELSWLAFNDRVLQLAGESGIPLLERAKFCAITCTNLDEFFQVRVAALKDQLIAGIDQPGDRSLTDGELMHVRKNHQCTHDRAAPFPGRMRLQGDEDAFLHA